MFAGFQNTGGTTTTVSARKMFAGFANAQSNNMPSISGLISDNLVAWFDPSVGITIGTGVSAWADTSGTYTVTQATAANQPLYVTGAADFKQFPYLLFDGTNDVLSLNNQLGVGTNSLYTIIVVCKAVTSTSNDRFITFNAGGTGEYRITQAAGNNTILWNGGAGGVSTNLPVSDLTQAHMFAIQINRITGQLISGYDSNQINATATIPTTLTDYSAGVLNIGGSIPANFQCLDILFYNKILSSTEWLSNYNYFKGKYGIA